MLYKRYFSSYNFSDENFDPNVETNEADELSEEESELEKNKGGRPEKKYDDCGKTQKHTKIDREKNKILAFSQKESIPMHR